MKKLKSVCKLNIRFAAALVIAVVAVAGCKKDPVKVSGVTLNKTTLELSEGGSETLVATVTPADAENKAITWSSSDGAVATVDQNGNVTAVKAGTATVTVTTVDGGFTATCTVTVKAIAVTGVTLNKPAFTLIVGLSETLTATVAPDDAANKAVTWESSNPNVATVVSTGLVTAIAPGSTIIVVTTDDGGFTATCAVTVTAEETPKNRITFDISFTGDIGNNRTRFALAGSGEATIDWGDGSAVQTVTLNPPPEQWMYMNTYNNNAWRIPHTYAPGTAPRTVTITGNVTGMVAPQVADKYSLPEEERGSLESLDVSLMPGLQALYCENGNLTALDVSSNTALTYLNCGNNQLQTLDISNNTALTSLSCSGNQLQTIDVSKNTALTSLNCSDNQLRNLDISRNPALLSLSCSINSISSLDISGHTALTTLQCGYNPLTLPDLSRHTDLVLLECNGLNLSVLDVSRHTKLRYLACISNNLSTLDVTANTELLELHCDHNALTSLDVSKNTKLSSVVCRYNNFTTLSISNPALQSLDCSYNHEMTSLVLETPKLRTLYCRGIWMEKDALVEVFKALPSRVGEFLGSMAIEYSLYQVFTAEELAIATDKNWLVE